MFICPVCKNTEEKYIGYRNGRPYCRRCIQFSGETVNSNDTFFCDGEVDVFLKYPLTKEQERCSNKILENFKNNKNTLVYAVCGAGKTELVFALIKYAIERKMNIGFAIPRRDVVLEISKRLEASFPDEKINIVCGGFTNNLTGNITCLTTHQLYRYNRYFDLLIMDEIDAFPYKDNPLLIEMFKRSIKGNYVLMSATPSESVLNEFKKEDNEIVYLYKRFHGKPLPLPKIVISPSYLKYHQLIKIMKKMIDRKEQVFVFAPTINKCEEVFNFIRFFIKRGDFVHSKREKRAEIIQNFKNKNLDYLVTTAVLERGVTVKNLQVIIFESDHKIFNTSSLIQISGRVGRAIDAPFGEVYFLADKKTIYMEEAVDEIKRINGQL